MSVEQPEKEWKVYPKGTRLRVLGHWTGHCAHPTGELIVAGEGGMSEVPAHPGHFKGYYHWGADIGCSQPSGFTTGLKLEPEEQNGRSR